MLFNWATDLREFWRRWHISLSSWLRDYLYISLGGNRRGSGRTYINLVLTMVLGGLWHGAAWNFALWGTWHGIGLILNRWWHEHSSWSGRLPRWLARGTTFIFVLYGWLLFRAGSLDGVRRLTGALVHWKAPDWWMHYLINLILFVLPLILIEAWQNRANDLLAPLRAPRWVQCVLQGCLLLGVLLFWEKKSVPFIYFQF